MHLSKSSIKHSAVNNVESKPKICQVLEFGSQANERVYMCLNLDFCADGRLLAVIRHAFILLFFFSVSGLRQVVKQFDLFLV